MAEGGSKVVVYAALAGNAAIAVVKFSAAALTGSSSMLSEAVHSLVDTLDQILLLIGQARSERPASPSHPFGYGLEIYFWGFTVALMVFLLGGAFSVYEGVDKLRHPAAADRPWVNYLVLAISAVFEGASFLVGYREFRKVVGGRPVGLFRFIRRSKDPNLFVTLLEDGAALIGLALAALGVTGQLLGLAWADGAASILIGLLLVAVAAALARETQSLIAGEAADETVVKAVRAALDGEDAGCIGEVATLQLGPQAILVAITIDLHDGPPGELERVAALLTRRVREKDERIARVYFRPSERDVAPGDAARA